MGSLPVGRPVRPCPDAGFLFPPRRPPSECPVGRGCCGHPGHSPAVFLCLASEGAPSPLWPGGWPIRTGGA